MVSSKLISSTENVDTTLDSVHKEILNSVPVKSNLEENILYLDSQLLLYMTLNQTYVRQPTYEDMLFSNDLFLQQLEQLKDENKDENMRLLVASTFLFLDFWSLLNSTIIFDYSDNEKKKLGEDLFSNIYSYFLKSKNNFDKDALINNLRDWTSSKLRDPSKVDSIFKVFSDIVDIDNYLDLGSLFLSDHHRISRLMVETGDPDYVNYMVINRILFGKRVDSFSPKFNNLFLDYLINPGQDEEFSNLLKNFIHNEDKITIPYLNIKVEDVFTSEKSIYYGLVVGYLLTLNHNEPDKIYLKNFLHKNSSLPSEFKSFVNSLIELNDFRFQEKKEKFTELANRFLNDSRTKSYVSKLKKKIMNEEKQQIKNSLSTWLKDSIPKPINNTSLDFLIDAISDDPKLMFMFYSVYKHTIESYSLISDVNFDFKFEKIVNNLNAMYPDKDENYLKKQVLNYYVLLNFSKELKKNNNYSTLTTRLNDLLQDQFHILFFSPLIYNLLCSSFELPPEKAQYIKEKLLEKDFDGVATQFSNLTAYSSKNKALLRFLESLDSFVETSRSSFYKSHTDAVVDSLASLRSTSISSEESYIDFQCSYSENNFDLLLYSLLEKPLTSDDPNIMLNSLLAYYEISSSLDHLKSYFSFNSEQDVIRYRRAAISSIAYYLNKYDLFDPGKYVGNGKHDCYDFVSTVVLISDLNLMFTSPEEFQAVYNYFTSYSPIKNTADTSLAENVIRRSILTQPWSSPQKYLLLGIYLKKKGYSMGEVYDSLQGSFGTSGIEYLLDDLFEGKQEYRNYLLNYFNEYPPSDVDRLITRMLRYPGSVFVKNVYGDAHYRTRNYTKDLLIGEWIYYKKSSPRSGRNDHHVIYTILSDGNRYIVDFYRSNKVSCLSYDRSSLYRNNTYIRPPKEYFNGIPLYGWLHI